MKIISLDEHNKTEVLKKTAGCIRQGGLVVFPSDTVYGFLADATNEEAVKKLISFKNRPPGKAISVFVSGHDMISELCEPNENALQKMQMLLPGPFTVILPSKHVVSRLLESEKGTLGVRYVQYAPVTELVEQLGKPVTATSANVGGQAPHYSVESFIKQAPKSKLELVDLIIDAGKLPRNKPSTILDLTSQEVAILRKGDILLSDEKSFVTTSALQTMKLARHVFQQTVATSGKEKVVFILKGDLGTGKTQFVKGIAEFCKIEDDIISPTFVVYYEYDLPTGNRFKRLYHFDLYNIEDVEEFKYLGLEEITAGNNILCVEWGEKIGDYFEMFKKDAEVRIVELEHKGPKERKITVHTVQE